MSRKLVCTLLASLLCWSQTASAAEYLSFGGFSRHFDRDLDLNEVNPGIGYGRDFTWDSHPDMDLSWELGVFKNSLRRAAFYGTLSYAPWHPAEGWRVGAMAGLSSGYHQSAVVPLVLPFVEWRFQRLGLQALVIPTIKPYVDGAVVLQFKWRVD
ncbi:hypothetical protein VVD49_17835 [Uliginosibacterium sp. H3]|uniref:Uncharacterized protein n=1 Tax=Uliginosibacterium silvisoli TaxID=3114758 RepID=A0ABU6K977_9RHOO|nr:hypothetical protein [Uliginosibacterium sp. H3]